MSWFDQLPFEEIWAVDFEFVADPGERPVPVCMVAWELRSGRKLRLWRDQLEALERPPYSMGAESLFVAFYASAEIGCHYALGWPAPMQTLDLFTEFRNATNGRPSPCGNSLLAALAHYGLDAIDGAEKSEMIDLVLGGGPWSSTERTDILDYCESDVVALRNAI